MSKWTVKNQFQLVVGIIVIGIFSLISGTILFFNEEILIGVTLTGLLLFGLTLRELRILLEMD